MSEQALPEALLAASADIRYVAVRRGHQVLLRERAQLHNASSSESDKYEELIVNPTLLTLVGRRGDIDCGGADFVLIRYGNFFQFVASMTGGHISIGMEPDCNPLAVLETVRPLLRFQAETAAGEPRPQAERWPVDKQLSGSMIARVWQGPRPGMGHAYYTYLEQTGLREYRGTEGCKDVLVLTREIGEETEYVLVTLWDNIEAVKRFAGPDPERAVYYPEDDRYFSESERTPYVRHFSVLGAR